MVIYDWSLTEPGKGRVLKSPVSVSQQGRYRSVMYGSQCWYSVYSSFEYLPLKTSLESDAICLRSLSDGKKSSLGVCVHDIPCEFQGSEDEFSKDKGSYIVKFKNGIEIPVEA